MILKFIDQVQLPLQPACYIEILLYLLAQNMTLILQCSKTQRRAGLMVTWPSV